MSSFVSPLIIGKIIGEVLNFFVPSVAMSVSYGEKHVSNGCNLKLSVVNNPPTIQIGGHRSNLYTLVMIDPDSPSPSDPYWREMVHWIVVDIPGGSNSTEGYEVLPYMPPVPLYGIHRLVFVLFQQSFRFPPVAPPAARRNFNTRLFAIDYNLGLPVAAVFFNSQKEPGVPRAKVLELISKVV